MANKENEPPQRKKRRLSPSLKKGNDLFSLLYQRMMTIQKRRKHLLELVFPQMNFSQCTVNVYQGPVAFKND